MLSATPVNTSLIDLRNQIYLMTEKRDDVFRDSLGISNVGTVLSTAQKQFKNWENQKGKRDKAQLLERLGADFLGLLNGVSIARSRRQIKQFTRRKWSASDVFPNTRSLTTVTPTPTVLEPCHIRGLLDRSAISSCPSTAQHDYLIDEIRIAELATERQRRNFNQADRERFLIEMIRTNFLKRLESSAQALTLTLKAHRQQDRQPVETH